MKIDEEFKGLIPPLADEERAQLEENIKQNGCRDPLVVWHGVLIDGHNRYEICTRNGIDYQTVNVELPDRESVRDWIDKNQIGRRNLTPDWFRYLIGRRYERMKKAVNDGGKGTPKATVDQIDPQFTADRIAAEHGVSSPTVKRAAKFAQEVDANPELKRAMLEREPVVKAKKRIRKAEVERKVESGATETATGKYRVVYADPPWKYTSEQHSGQEQERTIGTHYPGMPTDEICGLQIPETEANAVLFLWATSPLILHGFRVMEAWGFTYKAQMIWDKVKHNVGHYVSVRHEILLIGTKGSCVPDVRKLHDSVYSEERTEHSRKPAYFRDVIDEIYPIGRRVELFARGALPERWDGWGNEYEE